MYGPKVLEHFQNPRCVGKIPDADGVGTVSEGCSDTFWFYIKVRDNRLVQVRYEVKGCPAAIACCSMTAVLAEGKTIEEAMRITNEMVEKALGGLPDEKKHCSNQAAYALDEAIQDYLYSQAVGGNVAPGRCTGDSWRSLYLQRGVPGGKGGQ